jgi:hypothetical protein
MIRNFFINYARNMRKQGGFLMLNILGLTISFTSFCLRA